MNVSRIRIAGIKAQGRHGALPGEKYNPQEFVVDLDVTVEVPMDSVRTIADYRELSDIARGIVEEDSFELIETLAAEIADRIHQLDPVIAVTAVVHKPSAAASVGVADITAEVSRG